MSCERPDVSNQALDLVLGEIGVGRHGVAFSDRDSSALDHGPDPVVSDGFLPIRISQILWFLG